MSQKTLTALQAQLAAQTERAARTRQTLSRARSPKRIAELQKRLAVQLKKVSTTTSRFARAQSRERYKASRMSRSQATRDKILLGAYVIHRFGRRLERFPEADRKDLAGWLEERDRAYLESRGFPLLPPESASAQ